MIKFLQLLTIDRPILSFLFANACSCFLLFLVLSFFDFMFAYISYFFYANTVTGFFQNDGMNFIIIVCCFIKSIFLICYNEIIFKTRQNNFIYKFILLLKKSNIFKIKIFMLLIMGEFLYTCMSSIWHICIAFSHIFFFIFVLFIVIDILLVRFYNKFIQKNNTIVNKIHLYVNNNFDKLMQNVWWILFIILILLYMFFYIKKIFYKQDFYLYFYLGSLSLSYLVLFLYWAIKDKFVKIIEIVKRKQIFEHLSSFINKQKKVVYSLLDKYQVPIFILTNVLCSSYIFIYLIAKFYNNEIVDISNASLLNENENISDLYIFNYLYQLIRYILIFEVFDIYSKMESGLIVDFIKKLKTSSKCRKVTSIVLFSIDTLFILFLSRGTSCNHCCIYWIMSYFFGLMSMYFVMFYYWHLEDKHKDVLAEVEVKEDTGVV